MSDLSIRWIVSEMRKNYDELSGSDKAERLEKQKILKDLADILAKFKDDYESEVALLKGMSLSELIEKMKELSKEVFGSQLAAELVGMLLNKDDFNRDNKDFI